MRKKIAAVLVLCVIGFATTRAFSKAVDLTSIHNNSLARMNQSSLAKIHNSKVRYVAPSKTKVFPTPVIIWAKAGLTSNSQKLDMLNKMVYPIINESHYAIAAVMVEFYSDDRKSFGVEVLYHGSGSDGIMFKWNKQGKVNKNDYKQFLEPTPDG